ncbi:hypothetical protein CLV59_101417 [Chitinophaga dinghuensis]|uniref:Collagen triple helix repeat protein n=1 Tax=Chitinophaga dinghuensis TaxID=1539050 RepID=A0A327WE26_9BACT|nr:hypothetical protein [Chitinophaga dinghuensis]RAJ87656.1 hypothetical protein CLV59_101417 [Chitinophaga dinghuensis]
MKKFFSFVVFPAIACIMLLGSCKKGDTGPSGPAGPAGNANVIYSNWIQTSNWVKSTTSVGSGKVTYYFDVASNDLTQDILDKGTVLVYAVLYNDPDGVGIAKLLPSIYYDGGSAGTQYRFQYGLFLNKVRIICDVVPNGIPATSNKVRVVIIPGGVSGVITGRSATPPDYSKLSYEQVCEMYNIRPY